MRQSQLSRVRATLPLRSIGTGGVTSLRWGRPLASEMRVGTKFSQMSDLRNKLSVEEEEETDFLLLP